MSLYKYFVAPDPLFIDPIYGTVHKYTIFSTEPNKVYPTLAVFVSWADAFNFIHRNDFEMNDCKSPSWEQIKSK